MTGVEQLAGWTPIRVVPPEVDWCWTDGVQFTDPFFSQSVDRCLAEPFRLLFRHRTSVDELAEFAAGHPGLPPAGFIFHMSRCGSTLLAQMLAAMPSNLVLSEPGPVDTVLRWRSVGDDRRVTTLRALVAAMAQPRDGSQRRVFVKLDCWSVHDLGIVRRAFPDVPWIFLFRDPVEVLTSHVAQRGAQMIPGVLPAGDVGLDPAAGPGMSLDEYGIRVLAGICAAALEHTGDPKGRFVDYRDLVDGGTDAVLADWMPDATAAELAAASAAATRDAKNPHVPFEADRRPIAGGLSDEAQRLAEELLAPLHDLLRAASTSDSTPC